MQFVYQNGVGLAGRGESMSRIAYIVFFALLVAPCISDAETIDVHIL